MEDEFIILAIGGAEDLSQAALDDAVAKTKFVNDRLPRATALMLTLAGFDDDPRELWEIVEARDFLLAFAHGIVAAGVPLERFLPESVSLIKTCLAARLGKTIIVGHEDNLAREIREHQERVRRETH
jgi:hypothetical protein